jgi:hypothetical protein
MKTVFRSVLAGLILLALLQPVLAEEAARPEGDLSLRDVDGIVREVAVFRDAGGEEWQEAVVQPESGDPLRFRLAPVKVMAGYEFALSAGQHVRVRYFSGETPAPVQRIRNQDTGRVLRLRCLHGQPLWSWAGEHGGHGGRHGSPPGGRGGPGHGPGGPSGS